MAQNLLVVSTSGLGQESALNPESDLKAPGIVTETAVTPTPQVEAEAVKELTHQTEQLEANLATDGSSTAAPVISSDEVAPKEGASENETKLDASSTKKDGDGKAELSSNEDEKLGAHSNGDAEVESLKDEEQEANKDKTPKRKPKIPQVRKVNFEGFKNRFSEDEDEYALDVLVAGNDLMDEIRREQQTRRNYQNRLDRRLEQKKNKSRNVSSKTSQSPIPKAATQPREGGWIQRVRIQSQAILHHLSKVTGESWDTENPRTFNRPFSVFIYFQDKMKEALADLESRWAEEEQRRQAVGAEKKPDAKADDSNDKANHDKEANDLDDEESTDAVGESVEALRDIRCYVRFVEEEIMPFAKQFEGTGRSKVRFDDLWFLFKVGDLVCAPGAMVSAVPGSKSSAMYQPLWRVYTLNRPTDPFQYPAREPDSKPRPPEPDDADDEDKDGGVKGQFKVWAYYIDHDGTSYGAVKHSFVIPRYPGEREIAELPCYPLRYLDDWETHFEELKALGKKFESYMTNTHLSYNGWTLISTPDGEPMTVNSGSFQRKLHSEYIDSHVVVDFAEAFHQVGDWKPTFHRPTVYVDGWICQDDNFPVVTWFDEQRSDQVDQRIVDTVQVVDGVTMWQRKDGLEKDGFLKASSKLSLKSREHSRIPLGEEDYALLSRRMFAYVLKDRKFVCVDVQYLNEIPRQDNVFKNLKINNEYKQMVKGLVRSHLVKKELEKKHPGASKVNQSQDIIYGKGRGLVILLHGVPGVGKTATAEAVALEYRNPLFVITCGDLGLTPKDVEESLTEIFRLAHLWHCVLLFDEADVFLAQRSRFDLTRNALVSVFLRILEYYNGILFLTTNRVGTLDEAFKSRIHMSLYYPPLNKTQVELIFKMNLEKLIDIEKERQELTGEPELDIRVSSITDFATNHGTKTEGRWNGRQIRNAFQIASSLARYHALEEYESELAKGKDPGPRRPVLDDTQFKKVERATEAFKDYLEKTKGYNDADLAHILGERDDFYRQGKLFGGMAGAGGAAGAAAVGYPGPGGQGPGNPYPGGQYGQGMPPEHAGGGGAPNVEFPAMKPGPVTYGYNENSHPLAASHGGGPSIYQPPPAGLNPQYFHTPPTGGSQGRSGLDPFIGDGRREDYGHNVNYSSGGHPSAYNYRAHQAPSQSQPHVAPDESGYD
ncbi:putative AAA family ATPase [Durotheca rogersii]|uniref:putative AAA family ATPase n=1 Tax=Durotheca rogersii TaxID=419775 RepID=UPI00221FFDCE|nr:putative AAA family ATPase [Durotheca rogersii]KAI5863768.1 putative AAA family ATPase [Durotheca rogersii]